MLFKWRINVSRVRTLTRGADSDSLRASNETVTRSVIDRRIERRRPSSNRTTTNAVPRPDWTDTSSRR